MGRPSLAAQRREQVLAAFARCVARAGFAGTSLENVADEAGLARGHVRHYLGNRQDQVSALCEWVSTADQQDFAKVIEAPDASAQLEQAMHYLFGPSFYAPSEDLDVYLALFEEARRNDALKKTMRDSYVDILTTTTKALAAAHDAVDAAQARELAYLLLCAAIGNAHLSQMGLPRARTSRLGATCRRMLARLTGADDGTAAGTAAGTATGTAATRSGRRVAGARTVAGVGFEPT